MKRHHLYPQPSHDISHLTKKECESRVIMELAQPSEDTDQETLLALLNRVMILNVEKKTISEEGAKKFAAALREQSRLIILRLSSNIIENEAIKYIIASLQDNRSLITFNLNWSNIGDRETKYIADALANNTTLTALTLDKNNIGDMGAEQLAKLLQHNHSLKVLHLSWNHIGDQGIEHLARALQCNHTLKTLGLMRNVINAKGAGHLANALLQNTALEILNIADNAIGEKGAESLIAALQKNHKLRDLDVDNNSIDPEQNLLIAKQMQTNTLLYPRIEHMFETCLALLNISFLPTELKAKILYQSPVYRDLTDILAIKSIPSSHITDAIHNLQEHYMVNLVTADRRNNHPLILGAYTERVLQNNTSSELGYT